MVQSVKLESASYAELPWRFEAGTANVEGAVGLAAALDFLDGLGRDAVEAHEAELLERARGKLAEVPRMRLLGPEGECASLLAFDAEGVHPHDLATVLDQEGVAIRAGHLCAQPALRALGLAAAARASFGVFNSASDVDALAAAVGAACKAFR
jgi:cysteine desulfurase/selenocysteine lyase